MPFQYDLETAVERVGDGHFRAHMSPAWNINTNPNGGYIIALLLRAMGELLPASPHPISVTSHYLRPGVAGEDAELQVEVMRAGRRTSTVRGTLLQQGKPRLVSIATFSNLPAHDAPVEGRQLQIDPPDLPPPDECVGREQLAQGVALSILSRVEVRVDPRYSEAGQSPDAVLTGWIRFLDGRPSDASSLPLFTDAFPPSIFSLYGMIGWVPTIEMAVHVRRQPSAGWIKAAFNARDVAGDLFIEDGVLWDENDQLVAQSRQLQMILTGD